MNRSTLLRACGALATCAALAAALPAAAAWPDKPVTMVVPYPPGGAADVIARILGKGMASRLGQPVIIDNRSGAGTAIGAAAVARSPADGYTVLVTGNTTFTINPALKRGLPYDTQKDFESVGLIGNLPLVLLAHPSVPANNVAELVALAKRQPGKLSYGSFGTGTSAHLAGEMFRLMTGAELQHVPYRGSAPAMADLIGGQLMLSFDTTLAAMPQIAAGKVKAIAVTSRKRYSKMPTVPAIAESGYPDYQMVPWMAVVTPKGLPAAVRSQLSKVVHDTLADTAVHAQLEKAGLEVVWQPGSEYNARVASELPLLRAYVHKAGLDVE